MSNDLKPYVRSRFTPAPFCHLEFSRNSCYHIITNQYRSWLKQYKKVSIKISFTYKLCGLTAINY